MIILEHVSKYFDNDRKAVDEISFEVKEGESLVLLGTSGCGKTTTLRMINRLIETSSGNIRVNGKNIREQSPEKLRQHIGYTLQDNGLFPHYTVSENISIVPRLLKWERNRIKLRVEELMEKLHLSSKEYFHAFPRHLSGGQQQRVGLARALAADPSILLMDEPFGALDTVTRSGIRREFKELDELKKKTILMVTHDVQEAFELGDRICLMNKGRIEQIGTPVQLLLHPVNDFVSNFLGEHRLQLEFRVIQLTDLWNYLPDTEPDFMKENQLDPNTSLAIALERVIETKDFNRNYCITQNDATKSAGLNELMNAFVEYKKRKHHE